MSVFGLKAFKETITNGFLFSIIGILSVMAGSMMINIMLNLTVIANKDASEEIPVFCFNKRFLWILLSLFPILTITLFAGNYITSKKQESIFLNSAKSVVKNNTISNQKLLNYTFDKNYLKETESIMSTYSKLKGGIDSVKVVIKDNVNGIPVYLQFGDYYDKYYDKANFDKSDFIYKTTDEEKIYLDEVFKNNSKKYRFSSHKGDYELFYPYSSGDKKMVLYFSTKLDYGKSI